MPPRRALRLGTGLLFTSGIAVGVPAAAQMPVGAQFQVNTYTTNSQSRPAVAVDGDGDFVVVWHSDGSSGSDTDGLSVQGRRYASDGTPQGAQFQVNTYTTTVPGGLPTTFSQSYPSVAMASNGDFVVVWTSDGSFGTDTSTHSAQGQRYASNGSTQGGEFQVNTYTTGAGDQPQVAMDIDGDFVVAWSSQFSQGTDSSNSSIQGRRFASNGSALGAQFQVNTYTTVDQSGPSVSLDGDGDFVVVWDSGGSAGTDTSFYSIQGQRYLGPIPAPALSRASSLALAAALTLLGAGYAVRRRHPRSA